MGTTQEIIEKADLTTTDLQNEAGYLQPAQAERFIEVAIDESRLLRMGTVRPLRSHTDLIERTRFASRVLRSAEECRALTQAERSRPELATQTHNAQLFKAEVQLKDEVLEDNIEGAAFENTVSRMLAKRIALDIDEIAANGDTTSTDLFLSRFDGIIKQASVNVVAAGSIPLQRSVLKSLLKAMPSEFLRNRGSMVYLTSIDSEIEYKDTYAARETVRGDVFLEQDTVSRYSGVPVVPIPVFPENLGVGTNETVVVLTDPKNMEFGFWRNIRMERDRDIRAGLMIMVASLRFDVKFIEPRATAKATGVRVV